LPVLDVLRENFPRAEITVMVGPRAKEVFESSRSINKLIVYDKYMPLRQKIKLFFELKRRSFDAVIDLRNTLYGALLPARFRTSPLLIIPKNLRHMKDRNLYRLYRALKMRPPAVHTAQNRSLHISREDEDYINGLLSRNNIGADDKVVIVAPVARGANRRWEKENFSRLCELLSRDYKVILAGTEADKPVAGYIRGNCGDNVFDFSGLTNLRQLGSLMRRSSLLIVCDTGVSHLASYMDTPVILLAGAGDERKYGPWTRKKSVIISRKLFCRPCEKAQCGFGTVKCLKLIKPEEVLRAAKDILGSARPPAAPGAGRASGARIPPDFKRILVVRTDRIGDVLLSTPVIESLRKSYPNAYIAAMVSPYAKDIVEGNPYLDDVIIYDKEGRHKSWKRTLEFGFRLRERKFDLALVLHPTNRAHLVSFLAGIPRRVGYGRKSGFLLTDKIKHDKQRGEKHESEYALDLVRHLGLDPHGKAPFMPLKAESEKWTEELFKLEGVKRSDKLLAIHPAASCPSKIWPNERFAAAADRLAEKYGFKVLILCGPKDTALAEDMRKRMTCQAVNLAGKNSVSQLASVLKRCSLFISNDSGPVHIAAALGVPVISIFGRNQKGLSPRRWGPVADKLSRALHKDIGCVECLAHNCVKGFACLKAITVDDVVNAAEELLKC